MTYRFFVPVIVSVIAVLGSVTTVSAQVSNQMDAQFEASKAELQQMQEELAQLQQAIDETGGLDLGEDPSVETLEVKATVTEIRSDETIDGFRQMVFVAEADGKTYEVNTAQSLMEGLRYNIRTGDRVYLQVIKVNGVVDQVYLVDVVRTKALVWLLLAFTVLVIAVGRGRGLLSMFGLGLTMVMLFGVMLPAMLKGSDPVLVTVLGSAVILSVNMLLSHGTSKSTLRALASTFVGLGLVYVFAKISVNIADLSGLANEEAILLYFQGQSLIIPQGILLAGIILGAVGVLDDIAITQGETVSELRVANPNMTQKELFVAAMRVGRHHIASTVNTLVLAYAGVALPLLLLFLAHPDVTGLRFLNEEPIAEEIVRTFAGTMALVLTVPISTWFATFSRKKTG